MSFNYFDILKQMRDILLSIDKSLKEAVVLLRQIKQNTDNLQYDDE